MKYMIDSVILIDHFNGILAATKWLSHHHAQSAISAITRIEVLSGCTNETKLSVVEFLNRFKFLDITKEIADLTADLRREFRLKTPDAIQAAVAQHHHLKLVTRNTKDFTQTKYRFVLTPYEI